MNRKPSAIVLAKAAVQATGRAIHLANLAADALHNAGMTKEERMLRDMTDALLDAYRNVPADSVVVTTNDPMISSDELVDLLCQVVQGSHNNNVG